MENATMQRLLGLILFAVLVPSLSTAQLNSDSTHSTADTGSVSYLTSTLPVATLDSDPVIDPPPAPQAELPSALRGLKVGTKTYIRYEYIEEDDGAGGINDISRFNLKRGYLDVSKTITDYLSFRITPDVHQDDSGDWKLRIKYFHARFTMAGNEVFGKPWAEVGIAHMPWLDFEEHINLFRMQGTMFMERNKLFNSADLGVMFGANLGSELPAEYRDNVNSSYAGRWGSFQLGVFNGGGYHGEVKNNRMALEGRLTIRPLPDVVPGLQFSALGISGKGNIADTLGTPAPDWTVFNGMVSFESQYFNATGQYYTGTGNQKGNAVDVNGNGLDQNGYSFFGEFRVPEHKEYSVFARYDRFNTDANSATADVRQRFIGGFAWQFFKGNYWVVNVDRLQHSLPGVATEYSIEVTLQMVY
jgi:hypothetical protein